jgi:hypothetical protein
MMLACGLGVNGVAAAAMALSGEASSSPRERDTELCGEKGPDRAAEIGGSASRGGAVPDNGDASDRGSADETTTATVRDGAGNALAHCLVQTCAPNRQLSLVILEGKGKLLGYYFTQGERDVVLELGNLRLAGRLATRWAGGRREWNVVLRKAQVAPPVEPPLADRPWRSHEDVAS